MENLIFLDTSFLIALEDLDDQNHAKAIAFWGEFVKERKRLVTTTYVIDETLTFLKKRMGAEKAKEVGNRILESPSIEVVHISEEQFKKGLELFNRFSDKMFSFTDSISFVIMEEQGIREALAFDRDFKQKGYRIYQETPPK